MEAKLSLTLVENTKNKTHTLIIFCSNNIFEYMLESIKEMFYIDYLTSGTVELKEESALITLKISDEEKVKIISKNISMQKLKFLNLDKISYN